MNDETKHPCLFVELPLEDVEETSETGGSPIIEFVLCIDILMYVPVHRSRR